MINFLFGLILIIIPFILLDLFLDKKRGFIYILFFLFLFYTFFAFFTQFFGFFYYWVIIVFVAIPDLILLVFYIREKNKIKTSLKFPKIDWVLLLVIIIACATLYQVHYNYTGKINLATDETVSYHEVKNMEYVYPYFSDEWYAVSLIKHSINSHTLPFWDTLNNKSFLNLEFSFHSLIAEIVLLLNLNPLTQYIILSIFFNTLIIVLAYIFLRLNNVSKLISATVSLSILYITCGANLPGIWHLIPVHMGIIFSLFGFCFLALNSVFMGVLSFLFVFLFYPPISIFFALGLLIFIFEKFYKKNGKFLEIFSYSLIILFLLIPLTYLILMVSPLTNFIEYLVSRVFYTSFYGPNLTNINFYNIIPIPIILFAMFGIAFVLKEKKWLFSVALLGTVFWLFYSFTIKRFLIEYERVVFFTSIIVTIISGFGIEKFKDYLNQKYNKIDWHFLRYLKIGIIVMFLILIPFYTRRESWKTVILTNVYNGVVSYPKAPANNYLTEDDIRIFKDIKNKRFLSLGWKGTVVSIVTENYPIVAKEGTLSAGEEKTIYEFLQAGCDRKRSIAKKIKIDYIYLHDFDCSGFEKVDDSKEGLVLYKIN